MVWTLNLYLDFSIAFVHGHVCHKQQQVHLPFEKVKSYHITSTANPWQLFVYLSLAPKWDDCRAQQYVNFLKYCPIVKYYLCGDPYL